MAANFAISKAALILEAIANNPVPANIADLAAQLNLPRQTVHRVLGQICDLGPVARDAARQRYYVGNRLRSLSLATLTHPHRDTAANTLLRALVDDVHETCNIGMLDGDEVVYLNRVECDWPLRVQLRPGAHVPAYCTAIGKLLFAHLPPPERLRLLGGVRLRPLTSHTKTRLADLTADFEKIVTRGYAVNNQEDTLGLVALPSPSSTRTSTWSPASQFTRWRRGFLCSRRSNWYRSCAALRRSSRLRSCSCPDMLKNGTLCLAILDTYQRPDHTHRDP